MAKNSRLEIRCTEEFKAQIKTLADKKHVAVSTYIEMLLWKEIECNDTESTKTNEY